MSHSPSNSIHSRLMEQLVFFDEQRFDFIDTYFRHIPPANRQKEVQFIDQYLSTVEALLPELKEANTSTLPKVLIGCEVSLFYEDDQMEESFTICFPETANPDSGRISFLSPIGQQVLMRSANETIQLQAPMGKVDVTVQRIKFVDW